MSSRQKKTKNKIIESDARIWWKNSRKNENCWTKQNDSCVKMFFLTKPRFFFNQSYNHHHHRWHSLIFHSFSSIEPKKNKNKPKNKQNFIDPFDISSISYRYFYADKKTWIQSTTCVYRAKDKLQKKTVMVNIYFSLFNFLFFVRFFWTEESFFPKQKIFFRENKKKNKL